MTFFTTVKNRITNVTGSVSNNGYFCIFTFAVEIGDPNNSLQGREATPSGISDQDYYSVPKKQISEQNQTVITSLQT